MASPFSIFRRNQKIMLAVVALTAMVAFVFLDPLMSYVGQSRSEAANPVVVETNYGKLTQRELQAMHYSRELVDAFLQRIAFATINAQVQKGLLDGRRQDQFAEQWYETWRRELMERSKPGPEEAALETMILSKKAQEMGLIVSDRAINDLLRQITNDALDNQAILEIIASLQTGRKVKPSDLFDAIRTEMLASKYGILFMMTLRDIPPAQRFDYFLRLNQQAKVEVMPLAVADFVSQVPDPSAEQVKEYYEKYKNVFPDPNSPEPGFKEPKRAAFQYFKIDFAKLTEEMKPQVTEAEIKDYYEKNKEQFRELELPNDSAAGDNQADEAPATGGADGAAPAENQPAADTKPEGESPAPPAENAAPEAKPSDAPAEEQPADPAPADAPPAQPKGEAPQAEPQAEPQAQRSAGSVFRLVSTAAQDGDAPSETPAAETQPAAEQPATEQPAAEQPVTEQPAANEAPAAEQPAGETPAAAETPAETAAPAAESAESKPETEAPVAEPRYEPLEKVQDRIRDSLASQKAAEKINEVFDQLSAPMRRYSDELDVYTANKNTKAGAKPPAAFPFAQLAKEHNVEAKELPLVTAAQAAKEDIGGVQRRVPDRRMGFRFEPFAAFAFSDSLLTHRPQIGQDNEGNAYLFWKTEEKAAYVPSLEEIRDRVVRAWKMTKARELAHKRAGEYAAQAWAANKSLQEFFGSHGNLKVTETGPFTWMTMGSVPFDPTGGLPRLSEVEGVEAAGEEFMKTVFGLSPGGIGVANNQPQDLVYVVRLIELTPDMEELREDFYRENPSRYLMADAPNRRQIYLDWIAKLNEEAGVHWIRPADPVAPRGGADEMPL